jgi:hypothetical protein
MYGEDELKAKEVGELERLAALATRTDYSVRPPERKMLGAIGDDDESFVMPLPSAWASKPSGGAQGG